jgi:NAD(P)-dependent dehydrogenase (short-subunit alcohol dehydrogenase family)
VHGLKAFLPLLRSHGEGGHIVNTASMAGFLPFGFGAHAATKFAVVGISEALAMELEPQGIGVSVLCPGWVRHSHHRKPAQLAQGLRRTTAALDRTARRTDRGARSQRNAAERCRGAGVEGDAGQ